MGERQNYIQNSLYVLLGNALIFLVSFVYKPLMARILGPEQYGIFSLIFSTGLFFPSFILFSFNAALFYFIAKNRKNPRYASDAVFTTLVFFGVASVAWFPVLLLLVKQIAPALSFWHFVIAYVIAIGGSLFSILQASQQAQERFLHYSAYNVVMSFAVAAASLFAVSFVGTGESAALTRGILLVLLSLLGLRSLGLFGRFRMPVLRSMWRYGRLVGLSTLFGAGTVILDRYFLAWFYPPVQVGYYDIAVSLAVAILPFVSVLTTTIAPKLVGQSTSNVRVRFGTVALFNLIAVTSFGIALFYYSDIVLGLLLGEAYAFGSNLPLKVVALALPFMSLNALIGSVFLAVGRVKAGSFFTVVALVLSFAFNYLFVPNYGALGAALALLATNVVLALATSAVLIRRYRIGLSPFFVQLGLFIVFGIAFFSIQPFGFIVKTLGLVLFGLATFLLNHRLLFDALGSVFALVRPLVRRWIRPRSES